MSSLQAQGGKVFQIVMKVDAADATKVAKALQTQLEALDADKVKRNEMNVDGNTMISLIYDDQDKKIRTSFQVASKDGETTLIASHAEGF